MIDFKELQSDGEQWELFTRDFLTELGFVVEEPPSRGADLGKDLLVLENLGGLLGKYPFRWLVSCKNFAVANRSVTEDDERNLLERIKGFKCDGFLGCYSTVPSAGLTSRLAQLKKNGEIQDFRVFDARLIENYLIKVGYAKLVMRYFPVSYRNLKPLHLLFDNYVPLECSYCGKDLLKELDKTEYSANIAECVKTVDGDDTTYVEDVYWSCKGECDEILEKRYWETWKLTTQWEDISDLVIPSWYMRWIMTTFNQIQSGSHKYNDAAFKKMKTFIMAMGQKVLREMTEKERERVIDMLKLPML